MNQQFIPPTQMTPNSMSNTHTLQSSNQFVSNQMLQQLNPIQQQGFNQQNLGLGGIQNQMPPPLSNQMLQQQQIMQQPPSLPSINQLMGPQGMQGLNPLNPLGMGINQNTGLLEQQQFAQNNMLPGINQLLNPLNQQQQMRGQSMINPQQQTQEFLQTQQQLELQRQLQFDPMGLQQLAQMQNLQQNALLGSQLNPFSQQMGMIDPQLQALQQQMMGIQGSQLNQMNQLELMQLMSQQNQQEQLALQLRQGLGNQPGQLPSLSQIAGFGSTQNMLGGGLQLPSLSQMGQFNPNFGGFNNPLGQNNMMDPFAQQQQLLNMMQGQNQQSMINPLMHQPGLNGLMDMQRQQYQSTMGTSNAYNEMSMMLQQNQMQSMQAIGQQNFNPFTQQQQMMGMSNHMQGQLSLQHQQQVNHHHTKSQSHSSQQSQPQFTTVHELNLIQPDLENFNDKQQDPPVPPAIFDPGEYDLSWILEPGESVESLRQTPYLSADEIQGAVACKNYVDLLYLVKWKGLSYSQSTWEHESTIKPIYEEKINEYKQFNRGLDQAQREKLDSLIKNHKKMLRFTESKYKNKRMDENQQNMVALQEAKLNRTLLNQKIQDIMGDSFYKVVQYSEKDGLVPQFKRSHQKLKDYQIIGLNWLIRAWHQHRNVVLADEMGLGKTIMTLSLFEHFNRVYRLKGPYLILAPLTTLEHWKRIAEEWTTLNSVLYYDPGSAEGRSELRYWEWFYTDITYKGQVTTKSELFKFNIIITSFEVFMQDLNPIIQEIPFLYIVVDEAHRLKNKQAKTLKLLKDHPCKRILLLTGTPVQNNTKELWTLLNYIEPDKFNSMDDFMENYGNLENFEQIQKLHTILKPHFLRRLKEEVDNSIPPLQETVIEVGLTNVQTAYYKGIYGENRMMLAKFGTNSIKTSQLNNIDVQLRKCCNHLFLLKGVEEELTKDCKNEEDLYRKLLDSSGKLMLLDKFIEKFKKENHKMLIFSQFKRMLDIIELYLKMKAVPYEKLTGSVKTQDRISAIQRFNDDKSFGVFLLTTRAGGLGINLTSARVVIIFDSDWNPQNDLQAIARAHRIGQKFEVQVFRLITSKTYEEQMFERASKKLGMEQALFSKGAFHQNEDEFSQLHLRGFTELKQDSKEIENLLRYGAYAFMEENKEGDEDQNFNKDIDEILATGKKKEFMYNKGIYTLQKSTFNAAKYENMPDLEDPEFWNKVLPLNSIMSIGMLEKRFKKEKKEMAKSEKMQKEFFKDLEVVFNDFMDAKFDAKTSQQSKKQFEADEEKLREILNKMVKLSGMKLLYVEKCKEWMREMLRTNKRKKPLQTMFQDENPKEEQAGEEEEDVDMQVDENDIIVYESEEEGGRANNRTLRKRNPVVQQQQPHFDSEEKVPKKRGRKPKNPQNQIVPESDGNDEEEDGYGDEEEKEFNDRRRKGRDDEDYGESENEGYATRTGRKRQKTGREDAIYNSNHQSKENNSKNQPKINEQIIKRNEKNGIVCSYCLQPATQERMCAYFCQDYCSRFFHEECKELMFPSGDETKRRLRQQLQSHHCSGGFWKCDDCLESRALCFCCKQKGQILLFPKKGKPKAAGCPDGFLSGGAGIEEEDDQEAEEQMHEQNNIIEEVAQEVQENQSLQQDQIQQEELKSDQQLQLEQEILIQENNNTIDQVVQQDIDPQVEKSEDHQDPEQNLDQNKMQIDLIEDESQNADSSLKQDDVPKKQNDEDLQEEKDDNQLQVQPIDSIDEQPAQTKSPKKNVVQEEVKSQRVQGSPEPEPNDKKYVVRCTLGGCFKYYHVECVYQNRNVSCINSMKVQRFRCPLHYCEICQASGDSVLIVQCMQCPTAYHLKCLPSDTKAIRLTKKYIICGKHELSADNFPKYEEKSNGYVSVKSLATGMNSAMGFTSFGPTGLTASQANVDLKKKPKKRGRKPKNPILFEQNEESDPDELLAQSTIQAEHLAKSKQANVMEKDANIDALADQDQQQMDNDQDIEMDMMQSISQQQLSNTNAQAIHQSFQNAAVSQSSGSMHKTDSKKEPLSILNNPSYHSVQNLRSSNEERLMQSNSSARLQRQNSSSADLRSELGNTSSKQQTKPLFTVEKGQSRNNQSLQ